MPVILGTGGYRFEVVDHWATLSQGREFSADVAAVGVDTQDRVSAFDRGDDGKVLLTIGIPGAPTPYMSGEPFHHSPGLRSRQELVEVD